MCIRDRETDFQAKFLIPMAISIAAGIAFATVLTLVLVPNLMAVLSDARLLVYRLKYGFWPKRVDVEPARNRHLDPLADEPALQQESSIEHLGRLSMKRFCQNNLTQL